MQRGVVRDTRKLPVTVVQAETRIDQGPLWGKTSASKGDKRDAGNLQVYLEVVGQSPIPFPSGCMPEELSGGFFQGDLCCNDGLQKEGAGEGEALTGGGCLGPEQKPKAWSHQHVLSSSVCFSGFPGTAFTPGKEQGQLHIWSQIAYTQNKTVVLIQSKPCW